ncbi:MAG: flavodoxin domain-containing protein [Clostridium sp.]|nr:MAG: flavodoxin domain-containing protein [Clostridium sp.]
MIDAIVYYSRHGSTKKYAEACAKLLNVKCFSLDKVKKRA